MQKIEKQKKKVFISIKIAETTYEVNNEELSISISYFGIIVISSWNYIGMQGLSCYINLHLFYFSYTYEIHAT